MMRRGLAALSLIALLTGCAFVEGGSSDEKPEGVVGDMNMNEAANRADQILSDTLKSVTPEVVWAHGTSTDGSCVDAQHDGTGTGQVTRRVAVLTVISAERRGSFLGVVERYWKKRGYSVVAVRKDKESPAIFIETPEGFKVNLTFGHRGQAFFDADTPCVKESSVRPPVHES